MDPIPLPRRFRVIQDARSDGASWEGEDGFLDPTRVVEEELRDLSDPSVREAPLVVIVGAAGFGKSTAVKLLRRDRDDIHYDVAG